MAEIRTSSNRAASNKAKIARRVIEVLDYFDDNHREATVMDIVRRYDRPQSSTSELLSSLVELGLLRKDAWSRSYSLTPRAALIGSSGQPEIVRDGRLVRLADRLVAQTGLSVALFGMVGLNTQILSWRAGPRACATAVRGLFGGMQEPLCHAAPGWLLLSTLEERRCEGLIRRLNAEAPEARKFSATEMAGRVAECRENGTTQGTVGFGSAAQVVASLLPVECCDQPLVVGFVYGAQDKVNADNLMRCLDEAIVQTLTLPGAQAEAGSSTVQAFPSAA